MKKIIYTNKNGFLVVVTPCSEKLTIEQIAELDVPSGTPFKIIDHADIPTTRVFREAWYADLSNYTKIEIDMVIARQRVQDEVRLLRDPKLQELDVEYQRATETEDKDRMREVAELKQFLRDLPASPAIQEAKTPEELCRVIEDIEEAAKIKENEPSAG
jgi:hypothetical protein